jgi:amino acid permease
LFDKFSLFFCSPSDFCFQVALIILIIVPNLRKAKPVAIFAVSTMWAAVVIIVVLSIYVATQKECSGACSLTCETHVALGSIGESFGVYSFAFSCHASIPNFFHEMHHNQIFKGKNSFFIVFFCFFVHIIF